MARALTHWNLELCERCLAPWWPTGGFLGARIPPPPPGSCGVSSRPRARAIARAARRADAGIGFDGEPVALEPRSISEFSELPDMLRCPGPAPHSLSCEERIGRADWTSLHDNVPHDLLQTSA